jgi:lipid-binding SYLF domain-containing protein
MKGIVTLSCVFGMMMTLTATAKLSNDEVKRLNESAAVLNELRTAPDNGIPQDLWAKAECVVVVPSLKKAAFVFGGEYGSGVMSCKNGSVWSAPVFMQLAKGSVGFQIGAQSTDLVLLVMNRRGMEKMLSNKVTLGADMSIAAGPVGRTASAATDAQLNAEILSYSRSQGLFAGVNLSGGALTPDKDANARAYGSSVEPRDVALGVAHPVLEPASAFLAALRQSSTTSAPAN